MQKTAATPGTSSANTAFLLALALFFTSGVAGLIYQVVWSRLLTLVVGVSIFAITAVICTFMAGLALGSWAVGRWGARWSDPLLAYGLIEGTIGVYAALTPWLFEIAQPLYAWAFQVFDTVGLNVFRVALSAAILLVPTTLMGGTLPLLARAVAARDDTPARGVGILYAVNTFGGMSGCLLAGFVLLYVVGVRGSLYLAAGLNLAIAAVVIAVQRSAHRAPAAPAEPVAAEAGVGDAAGRLVLALFFLTGFAALGYEVLWTRALLVYLKASTYAFSLMLAVYLFGVAAGSIAASGIAGRSRRPLLGFAVCQLGIVATVVLGMLAFPNLDALGYALIGTHRIETFGLAVALMFAQAALVLLPPTLFMGAAFPFGIAAYHRASRGVGRTVGSLYAVNTAGNIAGSVVVGFVAISAIGVRHSMLVMLSLNLVAAAAALAWQTRARASRLLWAAGAVAVAVALHWSISDQLFYQSLVRRPGAKIVFYREGASDTVAVVERTKQKDRTLLYSDGRGAAGTATLPWNLYFGHLPMLLHPDPQEVLHICYGSGNSVLALSRHEPKRIDVVELSPHVKEASPYFWTNENVLQNPRVHLIIEDGRNYVLGTDRRYDVVSLEPPNIYTAGVVNLYTQEFYELVRDHLKPGGIMVQWLPTIQLSEVDRGRLIRAFTEAFPHVTVWQQLITTSLLLVGTLEPLTIDVDELARRLQSEAMARDVAVMNLDRSKAARSFSETAADGSEPPRPSRATGREMAYTFLSFFLLGDEATRALVADYEPVRDDRTLVDYSIPRFVGSGFGFSLYTYAIGSADENPTRVMRERMAEYAEWADSAERIVPDPEQAARVNRAIATRQKSDRMVARRRP
jgi:spermidine synthase